MKKNLVLGSLIVASVVQGASPAFAGQKEREIIGGIIGGVIGGAAGSQVGKGNGNKAATIIGAIAGALVGSQLGRELDNSDRRGMEEAQRRGLGSRIGERNEWDGRNYGSRSGARGTFTSTREGYNNRTGEYCREYVNVINLRGRVEETRGIACSRRDGSWYEVRETEVRFENRGGHGGGYQDGGYNPPRHPGYPPAPAPGPSYPGPNYPGPNYPGQGQGRYDDSVMVRQITRRTGGEWIRITFRRPVDLASLQVRVQSAGARIHEATMHTDNGRMMAIREFSPSRTIYAGDVISAQSFGYRERVRAIDMRVESMGGYADLMIRAFANDDYPSMSASR